LIQLRGDFFQLLLAAAVVANQHGVLESGLELIAQRPGSNSRLKKDRI